MPRFILISEAELSIMEISNGTDGIQIKELANKTFSSKLQKILALHVGLSRDNKYLISTFIEQD